MEPKPIVVRRQVWQGTQPKPAIVPKGGVESECHVLTWVSLALSCIWGQIVRCEVRRGGGRRVRDRWGAGRGELAPEMGFTKGFAQNTAKSRTKAWAVALPRARMISGANLATNA